MARNQAPQPTPQVIVIPVAPAPAPAPAPAYPQPVEPEKEDWKTTAGLILAIAGIGVTIAAALGLIAPPKKEEEEEKPPTIDPNKPPTTLPPPKGVTPPEKTTFCHVIVETTYPYPHVHTIFRESLGSRTIETVQLWGYKLEFSVPTTCHDWFGGLYRFKQAKLVQGKAWVYAFNKPDYFTDIIIYPYSDLVKVDIEYQHIRM